MNPFLIILIVSGVACATAAPPLSNERCGAIIERSLGYPRAVSQQFKSGSELKALEAMGVVEARNGFYEPSAAAGSAVRVLRAYPSYEPTGVEITLCQQGVKVTRLRQHGKDQVASGQVESIWRNAWLQKLGALAGEKGRFCENSSAAEWVIRRRGADYAVEEKTR